MKNITDFILIFLFIFGVIVFSFIDIISLICIPFALYSIKYYGNNYILKNFGAIFFFIFFIVHCCKCLYYPLKLIYMLK